MSLKINMDGYIKSRSSLRQHFEVHWHFNVSGLFCLMNTLPAKLTFLVIVSTLILLPNCYAQKRLLLSRIGSKNKITFHVGNEIKLKTLGTDYYVGGIIKDFSDSLIHFERYDIHIDSIKEIDIRGKHIKAFNVGQYGPSIMIAGAGYFIIDSVNQENINGRTALQSAGIAGLGYVLWLLREKKFKIRGRNKITIID